MPRTLRIKISQIVWLKYSGHILEDDYADAVFTEISNTYHGQSGGGGLSTA